MNSLNPQIESIHGHDVLHMIHNAPQALTREALKAEVAARFGPDARFHTCSAGGFTLDELLTFLLARKKIVERDGRLSVLMENVCADGQH